MHYANGLVVIPNLKPTYYDQKLETFVFGALLIVNVTNSKATSCKIVQTFCVSWANYSTLNIDHLSQIQESVSAEQTSIEDEMGLGGATSEDAEAEYIRKICESELVTGEITHSTLCI